MGEAALSPLLAELRGLLELRGATFLCVVLRVAPIALLFPALGGLRAPTAVRTSMVLLVSVLTFLQTAPLLPDAPLVAIGATNLFVGFFFGASALAVWEACRMVGNLFDQTLGRGSFGATDPWMSTQEGQLGQLYAHAFLALFVLSGAHVLFVEAVCTSTTVVPLDWVPTAAVWQAATTEFVARTAWCLAIAVALAAPAFVVAFIVDATLGWLNRFLPNLPATFLAMPARSAAGWLFAALVVASTAEWFATTAMVPADLWPWGAP